MSDLRMRLAGRNPLRDRLFAARGILAAAALVLLGFAAFGVLAWSYAVLGFAAIAAVALFGRDVSDRSHAILAQQAVEPGIGSAWIEILIRDFPDPVIVLDGAGRVIAFNAPASAIAPALRRREAVSLALRAPE